MRFIRTVLLIACLFDSAPARADWHWYCGDLKEYDTRQTHLSVRIQTALDANLDWRVLYGPNREGLFIGLPDLIREEKFNDPRLLTPLLGTEWTAPTDSTQDLICFGLDPRAPLPRERVSRLAAWVEAQAGLAVFENPHHLADQIDRFGADPVAFLGLTSSGWQPACAPGGLWDSLLTTGHHVIMLGSGPGASRTYVWAESAHPRHLIAAMRKGAAYVAEDDGIRMDVQVESQALGGRVSGRGDVFIRLRASARHPISRVRIIADGDEIWTAAPGVSRWELRHILPVADKHYLRFVLESDEGDCITLSNPIYLTPGTTMETGEMPTAVPDRNVPAHMDIDSAIEPLAELPEDAQRRILSEYLRDPGLCYPTALVLENRDDILSETLLWNLAQHPDPDVRLGATFALVVRNSPTLTDHLFTQLKDDAIEVRTYAARMILQYADVIDRDRIIPLVQHADPATGRYLIRALSPTTDNMDLVAYLIRASEGADAGVSTAAMFKLAEMGNRNFRIIKTLRDSARAGHVTAVDILGDIGDPRMKEDLEKLFRTASPGPIKRAGFLALQKMGVDYPDRPTISAPRMDQSPVIDGVLSPSEWAQAPFLPTFVKDADDSTPLQNLIVRIARDSTHLLLAFDVTQLNTFRPAAKPLRLEWAISPVTVPEAPFRFTVHYSENPPPRHPADPQLDIAQTTTKNKWTVECSLALSSLGVDPAAPMPYLRFNIALISGSQRWAWTPTYGAWEKTERYGNLLMPPPVQ